MYLGIGVFVWIWIHQWVTKEIITLYWLILIPFLFVRNGQGRPICVSSFAWRMCIPNPSTKMMHERPGPAFLPQLDIRRYHIWFGIWISECEKQMIFGRPSMPHTAIPHPSPLPSRIGIVLDLAGVCLLSLSTSQLFKQTYFSIYLYMYLVWMPFVWIWVLHILIVDRLSE